MSDLTAPALKTRRARSSQVKHPFYMAVLRTGWDSVMWVGASLGVIVLLLSVGSLTGVITPLVVTSGSMEPYFSEGALLISRSVPASTVGVGDVVTAPREDGVLVTHRVLTTNHLPNGTTSLTMQGDANDAPDQNPYVVEEVLSPIIVLSYVGWVVAALNNMRYLAISLLAAGILIWLIWSPGSKSRHRRKG